MIARLTCRQAEAVRVASATGRWTPGLEGHVAVCPACAEVRLVTAALASPLEPVRLSVEPGVLWARAVYQARVARAARMSRVLSWAELSLTALAVAATAVSIRMLDPAVTFSGLDPRLLLVGGLGLAATTLTLWRAVRT